MDHQIRRGCRLMPGNPQGRSASMAQTRSPFLRKLAVVVLILTIALPISAARAQRGGGWHGGGGWGGGWGWRGGWGGWGWRGSWGWPGWAGWGWGWPGWGWGWG